MVRHERIDDLETAHVTLAINILEAGLDMRLDHRSAPYYKVVTTAGGEWFVMQ